MLVKVSYKDCSYVLYSLQMAHSSTDFAVIIFCSSGTHVLENIGKMWKQGSDFASLYCVFLCMLVFAK